MNAINKKHMNEEVSVVKLYNCWKYLGVVSHMLPCDKMHDQFAETCMDEMERIEENLSNMPSKTIEDLHAKLAILAHRSRDDLFFTNDPFKPNGQLETILSDLLISVLEDTLRLMNKPYPFSEVIKQVDMSI